MKEHKELYNLYSTTHYWVDQVEEKEVGGIVACMKRK